MLLTKFFSKSVSYKSRATIPMSMSGDLPKPRVGHSSTACQLTDGSPALILFGGFDGDEVCDDTLIFVASEERWLPVDVG